MITIHHLEMSRSQRVLRLLEELAVPYGIKLCRRDRRTRLAPPEMKQVPPLGKSPVITDGDLVVAESGAILESPALAGFQMSFAVSALLARSNGARQCPGWRPGCPGSNSVPSTGARRPGAARSRRQPGRG